MASRNEDAKIVQILEGHTPEIVDLVASLRKVVHKAAPELLEEGKTGWGNITYKKVGVVCAIAPYKKYVSLHFYKGISLSDASGMLEGSGKALRHIKIHKPDDIRVEQITRLIQEAVRLDSK